MHKKITILALFLSVFVGTAQNGFKYESHKKSIKIPFQLSNNLVVIPLTLNNVPLNFLLDTGVENTILFSLEETDSIDLRNVNKIKVQGLGSGEPIDALHSKGNQVFLKEFKDNNHDLFVILDQNINFSQHLGVPIHGIIGYTFFKDHLVEINYRSKNVIIHNPKRNVDKSLKSYEKIPIELELSKPYVNAHVTIENTSQEVKMLIDSGGSDAMWLFENDKGIKCPSVYFDDILGKGFSGDIFGKRSRIKEIVIGKFNFNEPTISFPSSESLKYVTMVTGRNGSIGAAILKRFDVVFDYKGLKMYLKENMNFDEPFNYNMSGLEVIHSGLQLVEEKIAINQNATSNKVEISLSDEVNRQFRYHFVLKPKFEISNVRKGSPGYLAGFQKGDVIVRINGILVYKYTLQQINSFFQEEDGKSIKLEIDRNGKIIKNTFELKKIL